MDPASHNGSADQSALEGNVPLRKTLSVAVEMETAKMLDQRETLCSISDSAGRLEVGGGFVPQYPSP